MMNCMFPSFLSPPPRSYLFFSSEFLPVLFEMAIEFNLYDKGKKQVLLGKGEKKLVGILRPSI